MLPSAFRGFSVLAAGTVLLGLVAAGEASAHAHLTSSTPAAGATVQPAPTALQLDFSEGLELKFSGVIVTGPDRAVVKTGAATLDPKNRSRLLVPLPAPLANGTYTVDWRALSTDGHKTKGSFSFESMR